MKKERFFNKLFGNLKMGWPTVILFAVAAGIYTGHIMLVPALKKTSFHDIGELYEWWVIFAVIIVVNCKKNWEAMLKCFVFFLVSQPIIYAIQIWLGTENIHHAWLSYIGMWLPMTFGVLPGAFIAYYCKKQNALGAILLGCGNAIQLLMAINYAVRFIRDFPYHILSFLVCIVSIFVMTFTIQKTKRNRIIAFITPLVLVAAVVFFAYFTDRLHV